MPGDPVPHQTIDIDVDGRRIVADVHGEGERTLLLLNGGPGLPCDYLRDPHARFAGQGVRVVAFDQLGCGRSDKPSDPALWRIERYVEEVEAVRQARGVGQVDLLGHSWGGWLGIEYALP